MEEGAASLSRAVLSSAANCLRESLTVNVYLTPHLNAAFS